MCRPNSRGSMWRFHTRLFRCTQTESWCCSPVTAAAAAAPRARRELVSPRTISVETPVPQVHQSQQRDLFCFEGLEVLGSLQFRLLPPGFPHAERRRARRRGAARASQCREMGKKRFEVLLKAFFFRLHVVDGGNELCQLSWIVKASLLERKQS